MKAIVSKALVVMLALTMAVSLSACNDSKKMKAYNEGIVIAVTAINEASTEYMTATANFRNGFSEDTRQAVLDAVKKMDESYQQLGNLEAPDKYAEVQTMFKESADLFSQAAAIYNEQFTNVTAETVNEEFVAKLEEGNDFLAQAQQKMMEGAAKGQEIETAK